MMQYGFLKKQTKKRISNDEELLTHSLCGSVETKKILGYNSPIINILDGVTSLLRAEK